MHEYGIIISYHKKMSKLGNFGMYLGCTLILTR